MTSKKRFASLIVLLILSITFNLSAVAQSGDSTKDFTQILPGNTSLVVAVADAAEIKALINDKELQKLLFMIIPEEEVKNGLKEVDKDLLSNLGFTLDDIYGFVDGGIAIALRNFTLENPDPEVAVLIEIKPDKHDSSTLAGLLSLQIAGDISNRFTNEAFGKTYYEAREDVFVTWVDDYLIVTSTEKFALEILSNEAKLADLPGFTLHSQKTGFSDGIVMYMNDFFMKMVMDAIALNTADIELPGPDSEDNESLTGEQKKNLIAHNLIKSLELEKVGGISMKLPLTEGQTAKLFIEAKDYQGIFSKIISSKPADASMATKIPASYDTLSVMAIKEPMSIYNQIIKMAREIFPKVNDDEINKFIFELNKLLGFDVEKDFLATFGDQIALGIKLNPDFKFSLDMDQFAIFKMIYFDIAIAVKDVDTLSATLATISSGNKFFSEDEILAGKGVYNINIPDVDLTPRLFVENGVVHIVVSASENFSKDYDEYLSGKSMADDPDFGKAMAGIPPKASGFSYVSREYFKKYVDFLMNFLPASDNEEDRKIALTLKEVLDAELEKAGPMIGYYTISNQGIFVESQFSVRTFTKLMVLAMANMRTIFSSGMMMAPTAETGPSFIDP